MPHPAPLLPAPRPAPLVLRGSWWGRMWRPLLRLLGVVGRGPTHPEAHDAGLSFSHGYTGGVTPSFPTRASMTAMAQFGWVAACANALATDIASRPLIVVEGPEGAERQVTDHPVLQLLASPASRTTGNERRQREVVHWVLCGNAYSRVLQLDGEPVGLLPLFPELTQIEPWPDGQAGRYAYQGSQGLRHYSYDEVLHARATSWESDARALYGTGAIPALHRALLSYQAFENLTIASSMLGRITGVFTQAKSGDGARLSSAQLARVREFYRQQLSEGDEAIFVPEGLQYTSTAPSARDLQGAENQMRVVELICAVFRVPPVRIMLRGAKFSESGHQMRLYWEDLRDRVKPLDDQYTRLVQMFPNSERLRVKHDFSGVRYLQQHRRERQDMVKGWVDLGLDVEQAAIYEGFVGLPKPVRPPKSTVPAPAPAPEPAGEDEDHDAEEKDPQDGTRLRAVGASPRRSAGTGAGAGAWDWMVYEGGASPAAAAPTTPTAEEGADV